jgi:hypothetical protein
VSKKFVYLNYYVTKIRTGAIEIYTTCYYREFEHALKAQTFCEYVIGRMCWLEYKEEEQ